jgi:phosphatidylglycerol:prolipoprotein diacylglycerol transferase
MHPHIHIGILEISTWRVIVLGGLLLCWALFLARARGLGYPVLSVVLLLVLALPAGEIGGHLFNLLIPLLSGTGGLTFLRGLTVTGSIVFVLGFSLVFVRAYMKADPLPLLDAAAFTFPLSIMIGRLGCLLTGCCFGKPAAAWVGGSLLSVFTLRADLYDPASLAWHVLKEMPAGSIVWNLPLVLMLNSLFVLVTAETLYRNRERWRLVPGTVMAAVASQYSCGRFLMEFLRKDEVVGSTLFNPWQLAVLSLFIASLLWLAVCLYRRRRRAADTVEEKSS